MKSATVRKSLLFVFSLLLLTATSFAQNNAKPADNAPKRRFGVVNEYTVRPGMMTPYLQWVEKEVYSMFVKAGIKESYLLTNVYATTSRSVVTHLEVHDSFAAIRARNDALAKTTARKRWMPYQAKAREFVQETHSYVIEFLPELSWMNPKLKSTQPYWVITERFIATGRTRDYEAYMKNDWIPLEKKADTNGRQVARLRYGGDSYRYFSFRFNNDLTELDLPGKLTQAAGGPEAYAKIQQKLVGIMQHSANRILRLRPECSIIPALTTAAK
jgi:hypothetical protein